MMVSNDGNVNFVNAASMSMAATRTQSRSERRLARIAARAWHLAGLEARHAHRPEALDTLARRRRCQCGLHGVRIRALHRSVAVDSDHMVRREARGAALAL